MNKNYDRYVKHMQQAADLRYTGDLLQWDQEVFMPLLGAAHRARQVATLSGIHHRFFTGKSFGNLLDKLCNDDSLDNRQCANVAETLRYYKEQKKYTAAFVSKLNRTQSAAFDAWQKAKSKNKFKIFKPWLQKLVTLKRKECELLGYENHPYDALLQKFEPGSTAARLQKLFEQVRLELVPFTKSLLRKPAPDTSFLVKKYDRNLQWDFGMNLLQKLHFSFEAGRQDLSSHPFTTNFSAKDVRITTRINESDFREMIWSSLHECGHALYEQGLSPDEYGLPSGEYLSLAIHESQSRLWENCIGRSLAFWTYHYPELQKIFPENLSTVSLDEFYKAINSVSNSLIRTHADEITYHLHVMIRFEIEKMLMEGAVSVSDLPDLWNLKYKDYLDVSVPDDASGILQDVHWSHGGFGYFPTYSQGSFYAAQFYQAAQKEIPGLESKIASGNTLELLNWLKNNIYIHGRTLKADELCKKITGESLNFHNFMRYIKSKYEPLYPN